MISRVELRQLAERIADGGELPGRDVLWEPVAAQLSVIARMARLQHPGLERWGRLQITDLLGEGGFGRVYRAYDPVLERPVALKLLKDARRHALEDDALLREARLLARISHPNVITVYGAERVDDEVGVWMELIEGSTLETLVGAAPHAIPVVVAIGCALCDALAAVHARGLIHGDVKPSNVLIEVSGRIVLSDFGAVRWTEQNDSTRTATVRYAGPEVLEGARLTPAADLYSLGVVLRELAGEGVQPLTTVLDIVTAPRPEERFASAAELKEALLECLPPPQRNNRRVTGTSAALALLVSVLVAGAWSAGSGARETPGAGEAASAATQSARRAYLRGRQEWNKRTEAGFRQSMTHFEESLTRDPDFALAWSGMAQTYVLMSAFGHMPPGEALPRALAAAGRALQIDPSQADAYVALGYAAVQSRREQEGLEHYRQAIALDPRNVTAHHWYGLTISDSDPQQSLYHLRRAYELDPLSRPVSADLAHSYMSLGRAPEAADQLRQILRVFPDYTEARIQLATVLRRDGQYSAARRELDVILARDPVHLSAIQELAVICGREGRMDILRHVRDRLHATARHQYVTPRVLATVHLVLGELAEAAYWVGKGLDERADWTSYLETDPLFDSVRNSPEMQPVIERARKVWQR